MRIAPLAWALASCGRIGLDTPARGAIDGPSSTIAYVGPVAQREFGPSASDTFALQASAAGDAILVAASCNRPSAAPTTVSLAASGWSFAQLDPITSAAHAGGGMYYAASFVAIAPDTIATTATVTWSATCSGSSDEIGDELAGNDPSGGAITFDSHVVAAGFGDCTASLETLHDDDAIWAACFSESSLSGVGPGFTKGADDQDGDWTEYALAIGPAGTTDTATFANPGLTFVIEVVAIKPRSSS